MDRHTFLQHLRQSRLFSEQESEEVASRLPDSDRGSVLARALVAEGVLTQFQARQLLAGKGKRLVLGQYRVLDRLGRGGMGRVFKAVHPAMGRVVAIKVVSPRLLKDGFARALFRREVLAAAQLHHPHIATAFDAHETRGLHYLVMEYVEGPSLHQLVKEHGPLPIDLACALMRQAAQALQYAHEKGVVHRDIKPANLLIAPAADGTDGASPVLKVVDFGLARVRSGAVPRVAETIVAEAGNVLGTLDYISPEQAHDVHDADIRSDLYSLGCTFYYALTGQVPFPNCPAMAKLAKHLMEEPQPVQALRPGVPTAVAAVVRKLMAKDRKQRFQTPEELARELSRWCGPGSGLEPPVTEIVATPGVPADDVSTVGLPPDSPPDSPAVDADFREKWQHWAAIVEASVRRRGAGRWVDRRAFQELQAQLTQACRARAAAGEGERRQLFQRLEGLVSPWLTPQALVQTDLEIHHSLLRLCQQASEDIDALMGGRRTQTGDGETTTTSLLRRLMRRKDRPGLKETMRRLYGVQL